MDYKMIKLAEAGDVEAMKELAKDFEKKAGHRRTMHVGESISREEFFKEIEATNNPGNEELNAKAYHWYRKGAEAGDIKAMRVVAFKAKEAIEKFNWYYKAAQLGDEESIKDVAIMFGAGEGTEQSDDKAEEWLAKLDEEKANEAIYAIGRRTNSIKWLARAAEGSTSAMINLAEKYIDKDDFEMALTFYKKAAFAGSVEGMNRAGDIYYIGEGSIPQDYEKAFEFYQMGADEDDKMSLIKLAQLYYYGRGTTQDFNRAFEPKACGTSTVPEAMYKVADFYYMGIGTEQNFEKALEAYKKAYDDSIGFTHYKHDAANKVTMMYKLGQGVPKDLEKAKNARI